jgi:hypothetical protein
LTHITEDQQIDIMKANLQKSGQLTGLSGNTFKFHKQIDISDLHNYFKEKYHEHTGNCYRNYFEKYAHLFFGPNPAELFKFKPHKRSWILQSIKRFGDYYFRK